MNIKLFQKISRIILYCLVPSVFFISYLDEIAWAQSGQIIQFDQNFKPSTDIKIPYGKKVLITGTVKSEVTNITVHWFVDSSEGKAEANIKDGTWTVLVGPFPARQSVIFKFEALSVLSEDQKTEIKNKIQEALNSFVNKVVSENIKKTPEEFKTYVEAKLREVMPSEFKQIKNLVNKSLYDIIIEEILSLDTSEILRSIFSNIIDKNTGERDIREGLGVLKRDFLDTSKFEDIVKELDKVGKQSDSELLKNAKDKPEEIPQEKTKMKVLSDVIIQYVEKPQKEVLKNILDDIGKLQVKIQTINKELDELKKRMMEEVSLKINTFESADVIETSADVSALEYYAGFDVAALIIPNNAVVGSFFTINLSESVNDFETTLVRI